MASIRGYMAASVDGFIADETGGVDWLEPFQDVDYGYESFYAGIRTVVMGRRTFDQCRTFGPDWVYAGKRSIVVTSRPMAAPPSGVEAWTESLPGLIDHLKRLDDGDVWIVGGSQLQTAVLEAGAMDSLALFFVPVLLGRGVPLFRSDAGPIGLALDSVERFDRGLTALTYRTKI